MATNNMGSKEPKKEKNIKHGILAIASIVISIIIIIIGAYLYGQYYGSKEPVKPEETSSAIIKK